MNQSSLIIDNRMALKTHHKVTSVGITLIFWAVIFYLWQPLISMVAWAFGFKVFYEHMIILGGFEGFVEMLARYALIISLLGGGLLLWAIVNKKRFKNKIRRASGIKVDSESISNFFKVDTYDRVDWVNAKNLNISISDDSEISCSINKA